MIPKKFDYYAPDSIDAVIKILNEKEDAKILAGGQSLVPLMKLRLASPGVLVDINGLHDLSYIKAEKEYMAIGAMTSHAAVETNEEVRERFPVLYDAANKIADQQIRNRGTIGGSCCHADPAADLPTAIAALDSSFIVRGPKGERTIPVEEFFVDTFTTSVARDEILTEIRLRYLPERSGAAYIKFGLKQGDFAIVSAGASVTLGEGKVCKDLRLALGAVGPTPLRAKSSEEYLKGKTLNDDAIVKATAMCPEICDPPSDVHGSREYRLEMIKVFAKRALKLALSRAEANN